MERLQEQEKVQVEAKVEIQEEVKVEVEVEIQERTQASTRVRIRAVTPPEVLPGIRGTFRQAFRGELGSQLSEELCGTLSAPGVPVCRLRDPLV